MPSRGSNTPGHLRRGARGGDRGSEVGLRACCHGRVGCCPLVSPGQRYGAAGAPYPVGGDTGPVGNPFRPAPHIDPAWLAGNGGTVPKLARAIYDERAFDRLPVLADALEDAGCTDADILTHCRSGGEHVRGCWVVDLLLGKD